MKRPRIRKETTSTVNPVKVFSTDEVRIKKEKKIFAVNSNERWLVQSPVSGFYISA